MVERTTMVRFPIALKRWSISRIIPSNTIRNQADAGGAILSSRSRKLLSTHKPRLKSMDISKAPPHSAPKIHCAQQLFYGTTEIFAGRKYY